MLAWVAVALVATGMAQGLDAAAAVAAAERRARDGQEEAAAADLLALVPRLPPDGRVRAEALQLLGELESRLGHYPVAVAHAVEAARLFDREGDARRAADTRNTAGLAELYAGRYTAALSHFEPALTGSAAAGDWAGHTEQMTNLGNVFYFLGRYDDADRSYRRAAEVVAAHATEPWAARRRRFVVANQAVLHQRLGRYRDALHLYQAMAGPSSPMRPEEHAQMLVNQGALYRRLGDPYKALDAYDAARGVFAERHHLQGELGALTNRGIVLALDLRRPDEAVAAFDQAAAVATRSGDQRERLLATLYRGEAALRAGRDSEAGRDFAAARSAAETLQTREEMWKAWYGLGRVRERAGDMAGAAQAYEQATTVIDQLREALTVPAARAEFFQDKREVFDARIAMALAAGDAPAAIFALFEHSRARAWRDRLGLPAAVTLAAIQAALQPGTTLLSYWHAPNGAAVIRITRATVELRRIEVTPTQITRLADALSRPSPDVDAAAAALGRALIPDGFLRHTDRLIVVPDGPIGLVPFEVLPFESAPLVARMAVHYVPAVAALSVPGRQGSQWRPPWSAMLAAFGDPLPGSAGDPATPRLPATAAEVAVIHATLGGRHALYVGAANQKARLADALALRPTILHLATHGVADSAVAERSRLVFSPATPGGAAEALYLREIYSLPLDGVALAVLSACDTERGPLVRGEGVQGFGRALLAAGADSAVTTLWRVPDHAAARLMAAFYRHVQSGVFRAEALALAKRELRRDPELAHPHFWAAFVLTGDGNGTPRAPRWRSVGGVVALVAGAWLLAVAARAHRRGDRVV